MIVLSKSIGKSNEHFNEGIAYRSISLPGELRSVWSGGQALAVSIDLCRWRL